jgi:hypothetical protein
MPKTKSLKQRKVDRVEDLYGIVNELRRVVFVKGGQPDDIMAVATKALRIVRQIDNPIIKDQAL